MQNAHELTGAIEALRAATLDIETKSSAASIAANAEGELGELRRAKLRVEILEAKEAERVARLRVQAALDEAEAAAGETLTPSGLLAKIRERFERRAELSQAIERLDLGLHGDLHDLLNGPINARRRDAGLPLPAIRGPIESCGLPTGRADLTPRALAHLPVAFDALKKSLEALSSRADSSPFGEALILERGRLRQIEISIAREAEERAEREAEHARQVSSERAEAARKEAAARAEAEQRRKLRDEERAREDALLAKFRA
jgi:hypothetical protein